MTLLENEFSFHFALLYLSLLTTTYSTPKGYYYSVDMEKEHYKEIKLDSQVTCNILPDNVACYSSNWRF